MPGLEAKRPLPACGPAGPGQLPVAGGDLEILAMVESALREDRFLLAFQPVVQGRDTGRVAFHEGLARLIDATGRIIPAGSFMDAIEGTSLGRDLDTLALEHGLRALHATPDLRLSINLSARTIGHAPWMRTLEHWLTRDPLLGERLILEITESSTMEAPDAVADFMLRLQRDGICFAMDDFGAGYTALRFFRDMRFDIVKIDGCFIRGISTSPDNRALTAALVSIARHFDMLTVAEFVETAEDAALLTEMGVDCLQGYHFSAPVPRPDWARPHAAHQAV